jgi:hypothetical protein
LELPAKTRLNKNDCFVFFFATREFSQQFQNPDTLFFRCCNLLRFSYFQFFAPATTVRLQIFFSIPVKLKKNHGNGKLIFLPTFLICSCSLVFFLFLSEFFVLFQCATNQIHLLETRRCVTVPHARSGSWTPVGLLDLRNAETTNIAHAVCHPEAVLVAIIQWSCRKKIFISMPPSACRK